MIVVHSRDPGHLANSYLVGDEPGGRAVIIDAGAPPGPILEAIEGHRLRPTHLLCTHHHHDHVAHAEEYRRRFGVPVCAHHAEAARLGHVDRELAHGDELASGDLGIRALHVPGHTAGQLAFLVGEQRLFPGDTLFRRSVGGTLGSGATSFEDLRRSILEVLMRLPPATIVHPGHMDGTTVGEEWEHNPFIRAWRGAERTTEVRCSVAGRPATLLLRAADYDGGTKCWVRLFDGRLAIVGGSQVRED